MNRFGKVLLVIGCTCTMVLGGCGQVKEDSDIVIETREEIGLEMESYISYATGGDYDSVKDMLMKGLADYYAPISFYTSLTSQYPESKACRDGALSVAKYILKRLYTDLEVEQIDVNTEGSEARVLAVWKGIDTTQVDVSQMNDTIESILNSVYEADKDTYDTNTYTNGEGDTNSKIQEKSFPKIYEKLKGLYEEAPDTDMKGVFCFTYTTEGGWKISGIYEYNDLMYTDEGYNWNFEKAQEEYENSKNDIENEDVTGEENSI